MIVNEQEEIWIKLNNKSFKGTSIKYISNCGRLKRKNGVIEDIPERMAVKHNGERVRCFIILLGHFKPQSLEDKLLGRYEVDHKTHKPSCMNINDIRNLRWCTHKENMNFDEHCYNMTKANKNRIMTDEWRKKQSMSNKGKHAGEKNGFYGKHHSDETKKKISESLEKNRDTRIKHLRESHLGKHWRLENGVRVWY